MSEIVSESSAHGTAGSRQDRAPSSRRAVLAASVGNLLEAYDFGVYAFFAVVIGPLFFPTGDPTATLLLTVATFGVGFVMRPVGAIVLGSMADRRGRKATLSVTILVMALGTAMIGLAPTYDEIGLLAPAVIVVARLLQGFSAGGEVGSATAFLVEHAPPGRRGLFGSWQQAGQAGALLLASLSGAALTSLLSPEDLQSWGWRVPFLLGLLIGPVGFYIRSKISDAEEFTAVRDSSRSPLATALREHGRGIVTGFAITITWTVCTYFFLVYMPMFAQAELGIDASTAFLANGLSLGVLLVLAPVFGALSDRIGRRRLLLGAAIAVAVGTLPGLWLLTLAPVPGSLVVFQLVFAVVIAAFTGTAPSAIAELTPPQVRSTGVSLSYNFAVAIFGGFAPFIATWLIAATGSSISPAAYVVAAVALSAVLVGLRYRPR